MSIYKELANYLQEHEPTDYTFGVCSLISGFTKEKTDEEADQLRDKVQEIISNWPEHSGSMDYPVPHPTMNPKEAFTNIQNVWENSPYGDARRRLLHFVIAELNSKE